MRFATEVKAVIVAPLSGAQVLPSVWTMEKCARGPSAMPGIECLATSELNALVLRTLVTELPWNSRFAYRFLHLAEKCR